MTTTPIAEVRSPAAWRELLSTGALRRAVRWPLVAGGAAAVAAVGVAGAVESGLPTLRASAFLLALTVGFVVDDASAAISAAVPLSRGYRLALRIAVAASVVVVPFAVVAVPERRVGASVLAGVAIEAMALAVVALATAVVAHVRFDATEPGLVGVGMVAAVAAVALALPPRTLFPGGGPDWRAAHLRWAALLAIGVAVLIATAREASIRRGGRR